jgi:hypothetical protein
MLKIVVLQEGCPIHAGELGALNLDVLPDD